MKFVPLLLIVVSALLYANTLGHGFVLDDEVVLSQNALVQKGFKGIPQLFTEDSFYGYLQAKGTTGQVITGGRYRPLSLVFFAVVFQFFGANPFVFHLINVLLFAACVFALYKVLETLAQHFGLPNWVAIAGSALFAVHPVHTEVVANIKSVDELWSFLLGALAFKIAFRTNITMQKQALIGFLLLLSCLSKEMGVIWFLLILLSRWWVGTEKPMKQLSQLAIPILCLVLYAGLRTAATGGVVPGAMMHDPLNDPFIHFAQGEWQVSAADSSQQPIAHWRGTRQVRATTGEKWATVTVTTGRYLQLMLVPAPLTHDYYPNRIHLTSFADPEFWLWAIALIAALGVSVRWLFKRKPAGIGAAWFGLALLPVANVFFPVGVFMAERFLWLPSAGFCWVVAALLGARWQVPPAVVRVAGGIILLLLAGLTVQRNADWRSNETLFRADADVSAESAKLQFNLANTLMINALSVPDSLKRVGSIRETIPYFEKATAIHPYYFEAWQGVGASHFFTGNYEKAVKAFTIAATLHPGDPTTLQNLEAARITQRNQHTLQK